MHSWRVLGEPVVDGDDGSQDKGQRRGDLALGVAGFVGNGLRFLCGVQGFWLVQ